MEETKFDNEMTVYDLAKMVMKKFDEIEEAMATKDDLLSLELRMLGKMDNMERRLETKISYVDKKLDRGLELLEHRTTVLKDVLEQDLKAKVVW